jgi:hypothetical protein
VRRGFIGLALSARSDAASKCALVFMVSSISIYKLRHHQSAQKDHAASAVKHFGSRAAVRWDGRQTYLS